MCPVDPLDHHALQALSRLPAGQLVDACDGWHRVLDVFDQADGTTGPAAREAEFVARFRGFLAGLEAGARAA